MLTDPTGEIIAVANAPEVVAQAGAIILRVAVTIRGRTVVRWLTSRWLAQISPVWAVLGITWSVIDAAQFGFTVPDRDSSAGDISPDPVRKISLRWAPNKAGFIIVLSEGDETIDTPAWNPPYRGEPGSTVRGRKKSRRYNSDGYPEVDVDTGHDHGKGKNKVGDPHAHDWTGPLHGDRSLPRPVKPGDPRPPQDAPPIKG